MWVQNNLGWNVGKVAKKTYIKKMKRINWFKDYQTPECSGFILDEDELTDAARKGASKIRLIDTANGDVVYTTTIETYRKKGIFHEGKNGNFFVLPLQEFESDYRNFPTAV